MLRLRKVSICFKLVGSFAALLVLAAALSYCALAAIRALGATLDTAVNVTAKKMDLARSMNATLYRMRLHAALAEISLINNSLVHHVVQENSETGETVEMVCQQCHTPDTMQSNRELFESMATTLSAQGAELRPLVTTAEEKSALETLEKGVPAWKPLYEKYLNLASEKNFPAAHEIMLGEIYPLVDDLAEAAEGLTARQEKALQVAGTEASRQVSATFLQVACFAILALTAGMGGLWLVRAITLSLRSNARELREMGSQVACAAEQIAASNQLMSQGAAEQAASVEETSASTEEIGAIARENCANSDSAAHVMLAGAQSIADADRKLQQLVVSVRDAATASGKISEIIRTIDQIAFQTNILALNAAVEAARAGDSGAGFAVVADEVRNLAGRSAEAARNSAELISEATARSDASTSQLEDVALIFRETAQQMLQAKELIANVNHSGKQQVEGLSQISRAVAQLEQVAMQTAAGAEQRAAASEQLSAQSAVMRDVVMGLEKLIGTGR